MSCSQTTFTQSELSNKKKLVKSMKRRFDYNKPSLHLTKSAPNKKIGVLTNCSIAKSPEILGLTVIRNYSN